MNDFMSRIGKRCDKFADSDTIEIIDEWQLVYVNPHNNQNALTTGLDDVGHNDGFQHFDVKPLSQRKTMNPNMSRNQLRIEQGYIGAKDTFENATETKTTKNSTCPFEFPEEVIKMPKSKIQKIKKNKSSKYLRFSKAQRSNDENL